MAELTPEEKMAERLSMAITGKERQVTYNGDSKRYEITLTALCVGR